MTAAAIALCHIADLWDGIEEIAGRAATDERERTVVLPEIVSRLEAAHEWRRYDTADTAVDDAATDRAPFEAAALLRKYLPET